ncbi:MAG: acyl-CoA thioesterase [Candidatus Thiodiazotropha sp. (ex Monitilora ramsayi)]|nr:acyl-CoA thioesterase [Candidatus Thiodiazotropha sp. (ex Monitilora ramsayi)]
MQEKPTGELMTRILAMPADANPSGDIFGGWVMSQMDLAAGICAGSRANGRVVTVAVNSMSFIQPVKVGDVLCVYTTVDRVGNTSMEIHVEAWARRQRIGIRDKVTEAKFTFVALDIQGKPKVIPQKGTAID